MAQRQTQRSLNSRSNHRCNPNNSHRYINLKHRNSLTAASSNTEANNTVNSNMVNSNTEANNTVNSNMVNSNTEANNMEVNNTASNNTADPARSSNTTKKVASANSSLWKHARCIGSAMPNSKDAAAAPNIGGLT